MRRAATVKAWIVPVAILVAVLLTACGEPPPGPSLLPDASKHDLRVVSLVPSLTDCVVANGGADRLVGVTAYCDSALRNRDSMGVIADSLNPNLEQLVALRPDLVLAHAWQNDRTRLQLERLGIRVATLPDPRNLEQIAANMAAVGTLLGDSVAAGERSRRWLAEMDSALAGGPRSDSPLRVLVRVYEPGYWVAGGGSYLDEMLTKMGFRNIFGDEEFGYREVNSEEVIVRGPQAILILMEPHTDPRRDPVYRRTEAGRGGRVAVVESWELLTVPGPRLLEATRALTRLREKWAAERVTR